MATGGDVKLPAPSAPTAAAPYGLRDLTELAPVSYRRRRRELSEVRAAILHQTGFTWKPDNPLWPRVRAHFVVHRCGLISQNYRVETHMRYGSGFANGYAVTIEHEGNYPLSYDLTGTPRYWKPEKYGSDVIDDAPRQVIAARALLAHLAAEIPGLQVGAHRHVEALKSGCCGPDLWREVGEWARDPANLNMPELAPLASGLALPESWRDAPRVALTPNAGV